MFERFLTQEETVFWEQQQDIVYRMRYMDESLEEAEQGVWRAERACLQRLNEIVSGLTETLEYETSPYYRTPPPPPKPATIDTYVARFDNPQTHLTIDTEALWKALNQKENDND